MIRIGIAVALICVGLIAVFSSVVGLFRYQYVLNRIHAVALTDTLGVLGILSGVAVLCGWSILTAKIVVIIVFMWVSGPVSTHLLAKMELLTNSDIDADADGEEGEELL